ncbi:MAG TPA: CDGSH iron-sulfur domain-containing protein [Thermoprotei archaeon]|nr:CDGSH iron-sulfur domain-containing protein [Thermoprotei archaeon]
MAEDLTIKAKENGPYLVIKEGRVLFALCRCGHSNKKPYCDGSHAKVGFSAEEAELEVK